MADKERIGPDLTFTQQVRKGIAYSRWRRTGEARAVRAPESYSWLRKYPNNFKAVREAFDIWYLTDRLLGGEGEQS